MPVRRRFAGARAGAARPSHDRPGRWTWASPEVGALVLVEDLDRPMGLDAERGGSVLGLTATEGQVAVLLAEGRSAPEIARLLGTGADFGQDARQEHAPQAGRVGAAGPGSPGAVGAGARRLTAPTLSVRRRAERPRSCASPSRGYRRDLPAARISPT